MLPATAQAALPVLVVAFNGNVYGLDPPTGRELWHYELEAAVPGVAFDGGRVYVTGYEGILAALDYVTGREIWRVKTAFSGLKSSIVAQGGLVFVGWLGEVECYTHEGRRLWANPFKGKGYSETALGFPGNFVHIFHDAR